MTERSSVNRMVRKSRNPNSSISNIDQLVTGFISTTPEHPRLDSLAAVRCEFAKLYREVRDGRRGLRRSALMVQILREIRETLRSDQPPQIVNASVVVEPPKVSPVTKLVQQLLAGREQVPAATQEPPASLERPDIKAEGSAVGDSLDGPLGRHDER
jgi:hypothetical protein